jgi:transcriptional regulator with XRE-family HTH domain
MVIRRMGLLDQHVGSRIRARRERLTLTVEELASLVATHPETIADHERGEEHASAQELTFLADALGVPILYFYDDTPEPARH